MHPVKRMLVVLPFALAGCKDTAKQPHPMVMADAPLPAGEGRLEVDGGTIWYKRSGSGTGTPVVLVHGGPGLSSYYLKALEALGDDRPVVRYDQLGGGKSSRISDTTLMNFDEFAAQLDALRQELGYSRVHLVGHSWGAMLALEYYRRHPDRVESLVLASPSLDVAAWNRDVTRLVATLSDSAQRAIRSYEQRGRENPGAYAVAVGEFYRRYVWRHPVAADLDSTLLTSNQAVGGYMKGSAAFVIGGTLGRYDATPYLKRVTVPVLYTAGEFDEADPATVRRFAALTRGAAVVVIPGAAHMTTWDNPSATVAAVRAFLRRADSTMAKRRRNYL